MPSISSILVPLDGSTASELALPLAVRLASQHGARLLLVTVHTPLPEWYSTEMNDTTPVMDEQVRQREKAYLDAIAIRVGDSLAVPVSTSVESGSIYEALARVIKEARADLVVMTTHGRSGLNRLWLGSVTDKLIRSTSTPILVVRPTRDGTHAAEAPHRILVPVDGSRLAESILAQVKALVQPAEGHLIVAMVGHPDEVTAPSVPSFPGVQIPPLAAHELEARRYLEQLKQRLQADGFRVETRFTVAQRVANGVLELAETERCDLIALATHGAGGVDRLMYGSVADRVIRGSRIPVLVLHPSDEIEDDLTAMGEIAQVHPPA
jgi:nucleotide-binding universal stress UspA family protein